MGMISKRFVQLTQELEQLHIKKNAGYSGQDNPDSWANFRNSEKLGIPAYKGCMVRLSDKLERCFNLARDPSNEQVGESMKDTLMDAAAYCLITICLLEESEHNVTSNRTTG